MALLVYEPYARAGETSNLLDGIAEDLRRLANELAASKTSNEHHVALFWLNTHPVVMPIIVVSTGFVRFRRGRKQ